MPKTTTSPKVAMPQKSFAPRPTLAEEDWNFSAGRVPDSELVPCLLWEFLRESATARQLAIDWVEHFIAKDANKNQDPLWERTKAIRLNLNHKFVAADFVSNVVVAAWGWKNLSHTPWQKLSPKAKEWVAEACNLVNEPVYLSGGNEHTSLLDHAVTKATKEADDKIPNGGVRRSPPARAILPLFTRGPGCEAFCIVVDWGRYDNNAIKVGFNRLAAEIIKTRPKGIKSQSRSGGGEQRNADWRGKLNSLGRTRLYCYYDGVNALKRNNKPAYHWLVARLGDKGDRAALKALSDAKMRFAQAFREILPFEKVWPPICVAHSRFVK